jgi:hypothetical protein
MKLTCALPLAALTAALATSSAHADVKSFQLSLTPEVALQKTTTEIDGFSLNLWGRNPQQSLALGFVNGSSGDSGTFSLALLANYSDSYHGLSWGLLNVCYENYEGWQFGLINVTLDKFSGFQSGFVNFSGNTEGLQFGIYNYADKLNGLQLGLLNVDMDNDWFSKFPNQLAKGFPVINWSF